MEGDHDLRGVNPARLRGIGNRQRRDDARPPAVGMGERQFPGSGWDVAIGGRTLGMCSDPYVPPKAPQAQGRGTAASLQ
ncbi:hypothetical protein Mame01_31510 [Microbispora amethystogenes]|nr:hypothetical protein Mame01_31510 [Microbispora amethystogenes]